MAFAKDDLIELLRLRYDHHSAGAVFDLARQAAGVPDKGAFDGGEVRALRAALPRVGDRLTDVLARLDQLIETAPPTTKVDAPTKAAKTEAPAAKADKATPAAPEAKTTAPEAKSAPADAKAAPADAKAAPVDGDATVVLTGVDTKDGEEILMCGELDELGAWNPENARAMTREGDGWRVTLQVPAGAKITFKFCRRTPDGKVIWERGDDRILIGGRTDATWR